MSSSHFPLPAKISLPYYAHYKQLIPLQSLNNTHYTVLSFLFAALTPCFPRSSPLRRGFLLLQVALIVQVFIIPPPSNVPNTAVLYTFGVLGGNLLARYFDRLYIHVPEEEFHRINIDGSVEDARNLSSVRKFWWAFELLAVTRGIGWNWRVSGIPQSSPPTRLQFLRSRLLKYIAMYAGLHLTHLSCKNILNGFAEVSSPQLQKVLLSFTSSPVFLFPFVVLGWAITIYSHFGLLMLPLSLLCVGMRVGPSGWQRVESWPPNFGSLKEAYSIRRFWGYTWHQQMRRKTGAPGAYLITFFPRSILSSRSLPSRLLKRYFLVLMSFLVSGLIHACGTYNVTRALRLPISDGGELPYFMIQGIAIMVEDLGCWTLGIDDQKKRLPSSLRRWVGYMVTASWYIWSRVTLKAVPLALAHGIHDRRGELFAAVELVDRGAVAVPGNFVAAAMRNIMG